MTRLGTPVTNSGATVARWCAGLGTVALAAAAAYLLIRVSGSLPRLLPDYQLWQGRAYSELGEFLRWWAGDTTEAEFFKTGLGGLGMLAGGWVAHLGWRRGRRWAGFPISYGSGLWPWVFAAAALGLLLSDLAWGWSLNATGKWQPTFVPFVSVPPAIVLVYGAGWTVALTGAVLGAALTTPISLLVVNFFCYPLALPSVIGNVTGMWGGALIAFLLCRHLPWMPRPLTLSTPETEMSEAAEVSEASGPSEVSAPASEPHRVGGTDEADLARRPPSEPPRPPAPAPNRHGPAWVLRRALADFTEAQFYGNEIASAGLIAGTVLAYLLNPMVPAYGSGSLPAMLIAQVLSAVLAVLVYHRRWAEAGWYPTFIPVVSVAPATVLTFGPTVQAVVAGAVLGALAGPPLAAWISRRLPEDFHPYIGNVMSMTVCTLIAIPLLDLLPGFTNGN